MPNTLDFPKYAAACLRLARDADDCERHRELLDLAQTWLALYEEDARDVETVLSNEEGRIVKNSEGPTKLRSRTDRQTLH